MRTRPRRVGETTSSMLNAIGQLAGIQQPHRSYKLKSIGYKGRHLSFDDRAWSRRSTEFERSGGQVWIARARVRVNHLASSALVDGPAALHHGSRPCSVVRPQDTCADPAGAPRAHHRFVSSLALR